MKIIIGPEYDNLTVKKILFDRLGFSRAAVIRLKNLPDGIMLDGKRVTVRASVREGQKLTLAAEDREEDENPYLVPWKTDLDGLYEDDDCMVINKPSGMPTHPSHGHRGDTLANAFAALMESRGMPCVFRPVNRLDRETSGTVLCALTKHAAARLGKAMSEGKIQKRYRALLCASDMPDSGVIEGYVVRARESIILREFRESGTESEYSVTRWKKLSSDGKYTWVEAEPVTGRTHQLRVHFAHIGAPISGDKLYGNGDDAPCKRLALHACSLTFPVADGGTVTVTADMPAEMSAAFARFENDKE